MITFGDQAIVLDNGTERVHTYLQTKLTSKIEKVDLLGGGGILRSNHRTYR